MEKVFELLYRKKSNLVLLFTPPFVRSAKDPGYIKGYVAGVRENGGQYTHAATWVVMAYTKLGDGNKAFELFNAINPIHHSRDQVSTNLYRIEPYVLAGDVYSGESLEGRGGWSWYTGSSSWYYRAGLESILGISLHGNQMEFNPCIPTHWPSYEVSYRFGGSNYSIRVNNPEGLSRGLVALEVDGVVANGRRADLVDDGKAHTILATLHSNRSES
jgi:cellobiose phosphorylase